MELLSTREWATVIWGFVFWVYAMAHKQIREALWNVVKIFFGKTLTEPAVNNNAADSATILPIPKITPVKIPGIALGNNTVLIIYHLVAPIPNAASR